MVSEKESEEMERKHADGQMSAIGMSKRENYSQEDGLSALLEPFVEHFVDGGVASAPLEKVVDELAVSPEPMALGGACGNEGKRTG
jgi:hypothetical protein